MKKSSKFGQVFLFGLFLWQYAFNKVVKIAKVFEKTKNLAVSVLLWRRGVLFRPATHTGVLALILSVFVISIVTSGRELLAQADYAQEFPNFVVEYTNPVTIISEKPRDQTVEYEVLGGDTISAIAEKFGISVNTIRWANDLKDLDTIHPADKLKILPVTGVAHKVASGDSIYSIAKKYQAEPQAVLDFPFNDIGDDLAIKTGQILIIPDGVPPTKPKPPPTQYLAKSAIVVPTADGAFIWPAPGYIGQYFAHYHQGIDIVNSSAPSVVAVDSGKVMVSGWPDRSGYGNRVVIDHGNGYTTLYAHLSKALVGIGDYVSKGQKIGTMGTTGRSTGVHLHLEVRKNGSALNPLSLLGR